MPWWWVNVPVSIPEHFEFSVVLSDWKIWPLFEVNWICDMILLAFKLLLLFLSSCTMWSVLSGNPRSSIGAINHLQLKNKFYKLICRVASNNVSRSQRWPNTTYFSSCQSCGLVFVTLNFVNIGSELLRGCNCDFEDWFHGHWLPMAYLEISAICNSKISLHKVLLGF